MNIPPHTNPVIPRCPRCRAKDVIREGWHTARKEQHAVTQLSIDAMALSHRTGLPVKAFIMCVV
jgi:hypothetical protein